MNASSSVRLKRWIVDVPISVWCSSKDVGLRPPMVLTSLSWVLEETVNNSTHYLAFPSLHRYTFKGVRKEEVLVARQEGEKYGFRRPMRNVYTTRWRPGPPHAGNTWYTRGDHIDFILLLNRDDVWIPFTEKNTGSLLTEASMLRSCLVSVTSRISLPKLALSTKSSRCSLAGDGSILLECLKKADT